MIPDADLCQAHAALLASRLLSEQESNGSVLEELRRLDQAVADLRAQAGVEASELRARVRELERQVELLTASPPDPDAAARASKAPKAERAATRAAKAERAAAKKAKAAKVAEGRPQEHDEENELD
jgi:DNA-binding protein H-NS